MSDVINELMISTRQKHGVTSVLVTHDMKSAKKVADRIVMLYPLSRLRENEPQILFDGTPEQIERCGDSRVTQFVRGEAGERLMEMAEQAEAESGA
jgi:phospholipid/cholesterol/gamma-HCH transport system ATP-binding protein